jgi:voltage-gated potassium channel Kch
VHRIHYRFGWLLLLIGFAMFFVMATPKGDVSRFVSVTLQALIMITAVVVSRAHPWLIRGSIVVGIVGVVGAGLALFGTDQFGNASSGAIAFIYVVLTPPAIVFGVVKQFREEGAVTIHSMFGVLCLYLLIGLLFAVAYATIQDINPDTNFLNAEDTGRDDFIYFSFSTLTTTGYGDVVAATNLGRSLAITEALIGQFYLVTVVALIIANMRSRVLGTRPE